MAAPVSVWYRDFFSISWIFTGGNRFIDYMIVLKKFLTKISCQAPYTFISMLSPLNKIKNRHLFIPPAALPGLMNVVVWFQLSDKKWGVRVMQWHIMSHKLCTVIRIALPAVSSVCSQLITFATWFYRHTIFSADLYKGPAKSQPVLLRYRPDFWKILSYLWVQVNEAYNTGLRVSWKLWGYFFKK